MRKIKITLKIITSLLIMYLLVDLCVFRINTMPILTQINHDEFVKDIGKITDLNDAKIQLRKGVDEKYNSIYLQNKLNIRYIYILVSLFLINIFELIFIKKDSFSSNVSSSGGSF